MTPDEGHDLPPGAAPGSTGAHTRSRAGLILRRTLLVLAAVLFALVLCEIGCRVLAAWDNHDTFEVAIQEQRQVAPDHRVALIDILKASDDDRIIFELKPHMDGMLFKDAPVTTNRHGFRGPEYDEEEPPNTITIVGIGDSVMFGYGVPDGTDYLSVLERRLNQMYPQKSWRCINTAVPSYNTVMEVETLKVKGLRFGPDLVILGIVPNDLVLPPYIRVVDDVFDLQRSFLYERLTRGTRWDTRRNGFELTDGRDPQLLFLKGVEGALDNVPEKYEAMRGLDAFKLALDELDQMSREHGFPVVFFTNTEDKVTGPMFQAAKAKGWPWSRLLPDINRYLVGNGSTRWDPDHPESYLKSALSVTPDDGHPSVLQHTMAATRLMQDLKSSGIIDQLLAK